MTTPTPPAARRVLVTGANGFIGMNTLEPLLQRGYEVHAVAGRRGPGEASREVEWHRADLLDREAVEALVAAVGPSHLAHLAWYMEPGAWGPSLENARWVEASLHLVRTFHEGGGRRVVVAGSGTEYDWAYGYCSEARTPIQPSSYYGLCKGALSTILGGYSEGAEDLTIGWGRIFFTYGPHEDPVRLIAAVTNSLLKGERAKTSHGRQVRDYLYIKDVAGALVALLDSEIEGPINIGSGQPITLLALITRLASRLDAEELLDVGAIPARKSDTPLVVADVQRLESELEWQPSYSLDQGLDETIEWWRQHPA